MCPHPENTKPSKTEFSATPWPSVGRLCPARKPQGEEGSPQWLMANASFFFDDLLAAKVLEFNPHFAEG